MSRYKVFLLNLDRSKDRLSSCIDEFTRLNVDFERIQAIYGADLKPKELQEVYSHQLNVKSYHKDLNVGEIGCYLSHRLAWQKIVEEKLDFAVIFEDDFRFQCEDFNLVVKSVADIGRPWFYIKLSAREKQLKKIKSQALSEFQLILLSKVPARTCAQIVSYEGALRLLDTSKKIIRPIDVDLKYWWEKGITVEALRPAPIKALDGGESVIAELGARKEAKQRKFQKFINQIVYYFRNKIELKKLQVED